MNHPQAAINCEQAVEQMRPYLEGELPADTAEALRAHLNSCPRCKKHISARHKVISALSEAYGPIKISKNFHNSANSRLDTIRKTTEHALVPAGDEPFDEVEDERELEPVGAAAPGLFSGMSAAPWWAVSVALHILVIALAGLISMAIELPKTDESVVMVTELTPLKDVKVEEEEKKPAQENRNALESKQEVPPTDPTSKDLSDIVVPPDILAKAELGDHFETINLDRPDTQSAFGNPDAKMFHSIQGNDEPEGGGGMGGAGLDELIGVGGNASPGTGGGWGGGNGTGVGVGNGAGRGSFGNRNGGGRRLMVKRHGGSPRTEGAVDKALEWLARHQEPDGHWDCVKHEGRAEERTNGVNGNAAMTGFALLAFLGAGHTEKIGKYKDHVKRGQDWLIKTLNETEKAEGKGRFTKLNYTQGIAALALAEGCGMSPRNAELKDAAQRAIDGVTAGQIKDGESEYQAWDYHPGGRVNDTSVSGWCVMALKSAKVSGLQVHFASFEGAMRWINAGQELANAPKVGDAEYWEGGMMNYRGTLQNPRSRVNMAMTSAASLTRLMVGGERPDHPGVAGPCNLMKKAANLPNKWPGNLYYWYYGTFTMFQKGGDHWKEWNEPMKKTLPDAQRKDGDFDGSWDPFFTEDLGYIYGGRVQSTSLGALCLEVYYRYQKIN